MKIRTQKFTWMMTASLFALLTGAPAWADDTELLLVNPAVTSTPKPNILFILDTSGSMDSLEDTIEAYDNTELYNGDCSRDKLYWTDINVLPVCDPNGNDTQVILKSSFMCEAASNQIDGIGSYTDTLVQRRDFEYFYSFLQTALVWLELEPGNETDLVECQADRGVHGDGTAGEVWPSKWIYVGDYVGIPWETDPADEFAWGSAPRNKEYTVYDGNYLNWKNSPAAIQLTRLDIVKQVTKTVLRSVSDVNVGIMRFNDRNGGPVIQAVKDLDANRAIIEATIDGLDHDGRTPLSEALYESALYWTGQPAHFGENINEWPTDPAALASTGPEVYQSPALDACAKNYNVLLTDGNPVDDEEAHALVPTLPNYTAVTGNAACVGTEQGDCLDDIAYWLANVGGDPNAFGSQTVATHTIGFSIDLPILADAAAASGGKYFLADDVESLTIALLKIVSDVTERSLSFSAPAVSVNTFNRTQNLNDLYLTMFGAKAKVHWPGNLKKYKITNRQITDANGLSAVNPNTGFFFDSAQSFWTTTRADGNDVLKGGAASLLPDPTVRELYTNNGNSIELTDSTNALTPSNAGAFDDTDFGLSGAAGEPTKDEIIRWMRGEDVRDEDQNSTTTVRNAMGDPLHSQPAAIVYGGTPANPEVVVYTATNDGYLHAIDGNTGTELWSYIPKGLLKNMNRLYFDPDSKFKNYGLDGNVVPVVSDKNNNGVVDPGEGDFVYLIFGMRRGGNQYFALDVTYKYAPKLMWTASPSGIGETWSTPVVARIDAPGLSGTNAEKGVVVIGGGYDTVHDVGSHPTNDDANGAAVIMLDLRDGSELWRATTNAGALGLTVPAMNRAIPGQVRVIDISGDGLADRMYAADLGGQVLRFDIYNGAADKASLVTGGVIARLGAEGLPAPVAAADTRRFYTSPDVSIFTSDRLDRRFLAISIGSGYRAHPLDKSNTDRFYSLRDANVFEQLDQTTYDNLPIITEANLVEVSGSKQAVLTEQDKGWMFTLPADQKVLSDSITFNNEVLFVAFSPESNVNVSACEVGAGTNTLYRVSVVNGDPVVNNLDTLDPNDADDARRMSLQQGGIAPTPTVLFPSPDDPDCTGAACAPPPLGCVGVECFDPGFVNNPVRTLWTQDGIE